MKLLDLPDRVLYQIPSNEAVQPVLAELARKYHLETSHNFGLVIKYLKQLKNNDLNDLKAHCLWEEIKELKQTTQILKKQLHRVEAKYQHQLTLLKKRSQDFKPGDFTFLRDTLTIHMLTKAYNAIESLEVWSFFDKEEIPSNGYTIYQIREKLNSDELDDQNLTFILEWMHKIRKDSWNEIVRKALEDNAQEAGILNIAWASL